MAYFYLVAVMAGLVFIEILGTQPERSNWQGLVLAQIVLLSLNLVLGQTLILPLYFGGGDLLFHMGLISTIIDSGHVTSTMGGYQYFPLFHIFGAGGVLLTEMQLVASYFVFYGLSFAISLPIVYLLVKQITKDARLPLLATLLYCLIREVIFNGMYVNTREMAYMLCLLVLYLVIQENRWLRIIAVGLILPLVLLHQTTLFHFSAILIVIMIVEFILRRRSRYVGLNYVVLFTLAYVGYWFWVAYPFVSSWLIAFTASETVYVPLAEQAIRQPPFATVAVNVDYSLVLFFVIIGIMSQLRQEDQDAAMTHVFALFTYVAIPFFVPSVTRIISPLFLTYRLSLILSPMIALAMAAGVLALAPRSGQSRQLSKLVKSVAPFGLILFLILLYSFSSVFVHGTTTDLNPKQLEDIGPRRYFTQAEVMSLSFIAKYKGDVPILTDAHSSYYLRGYLHTPANGTVVALDPLSVEEGYMLFRIEEFELRGVLLFDPLSREAVYNEPYKYRTGDTPDLEIVWQTANKVFNNGSVQIYQKQRV